MWPSSAIYKFCLVPVPSTKSGVTFPTAIVKCYETSTISSILFSIDAFYACIFINNIKIKLVAYLNGGWGRGNTFFSVSTLGRLRCE